MRKYTSNVEFTAALTNAKTVMENKDAMQDEVDSAWRELLLATSNLQRIPDKSALEQLIKDAGNYRAADYTAQSYAVLENALASAKTVMDNANANQEDVDQAVKALENAVA